MRILISNDDGIYSPGILPLAKAAARFSDVRIVAPDVEQSSMSHAITSSRPLRFKRVHVGEFEAYSVNGTPRLRIASPSARIAGNTSTLFFQASISASTLGTHAGIPARWQQRNRRHYLGRVASLSAQT